MKRILYPIMALCYNNGMLSPPDLAPSLPDLAKNYSVPQCKCHQGDSLLRLKESGSECFELGRRLLWAAALLPQPHTETHGTHTHTYLAVFLFFLRAHLDLQGKFNTWTTAAV